MENTEIKTTYEMSEIVKRLEKLFDFLNANLFENKLTPCVISVQADQTKGAYGWYTCKEVWVSADKSETRHEICITADHLDRSPKEIAETMLHEMVHHYCTINGIKDTSRSGSYHNTKYRDEALAHGLTCECDAKYGWTITNLSEKAEKKLVSKGLLNLQFAFHRLPKVKKTRSGNSHSIKYVCPCCGAIARTTKALALICGDCDELMVEA